MRRVLLTGAGLRLVLLLAGLWQDAHSRVRYTDIDYDVFSDAAAAIAAGGSPVCAAAPAAALTNKVKVTRLACRDRSMSERHTGTHRS